LGPEIQGSSRRRIIFKLLRLSAAAGVAGALLNETPIKPVPPVAATVSGGTIVSGSLAFWSDLTGTLGSVDGGWNHDLSSIALGYNNHATDLYSTVGGGLDNTASKIYTTIAGGYFNWAGASGATIGGGVQNTVSGSYATLGGGSNNEIGGDYATVGGGYDNTASAAFDTIGGGASNAATETDATVGGGDSNTATGGWSTIGGGYRNTASGLGSFVGGGGYSGTNNSGNIAAGTASTVGGGVGNVTSGTAATVGGGWLNSAGGTGSFIGGGGYNGTFASGNLAFGELSTIGGGMGNVASGSLSTIGGGSNNSASRSFATVGGGEGNAATGIAATIPGGLSNSAGAEFSFAAGTLATTKSGHHGAMILSDDSDLSNPFVSVAPDEFAVRATGGFRFVTGTDAAGNVTQLATITSSGSIGVLTGSPSYPLDLHTSGLSASQVHITSTGTDSGGYVTSANAGNLFMSAGAAWNGSAWIAKSSSSYQYGGGTAGVRFFFDTGLTVGNTYTPTTRMFIGPTGHVGIGMSTAPAHLLQLGLDDAAKPSTNTWTIASDGRLKDPESIEPFTEGSEFIKRLPQPVWFRYRKDSGLPDDRRVAGWIAQDIAPVAPFMVRRTRQKLSEKDDSEADTLSLNTNELPYALVNSVKQILQRLGRLEEDNRRLQQTNDQLNKLRVKVDELERTGKTAKSAPSSI
jgi:hypothetical protein